MAEPTIDPHGDSPRDHLPPRRSSPLRTLLLIGALVAIVVGGLWDHYGARMPRDQAYDAIQALQAGTGEGVAQRAVTQEDIQKAIGRAASDESTEEGLVYEKYSWRRGMPIWTYDIYVAYVDDAGAKRLIVADKDEKPNAAMYGELMKRTRPEGAETGEDAPADAATDGQSPAPDSSSPDAPVSDEDAAAPISDDPAPTPEGEDPASPKSDPPVASPEAGETETSADPPSEPAGQP